MSFKLYRNESDPFEQFGDEEASRSSRGVLKISRPDGTFTYINSALWASIDETPAPSGYASQAAYSTTGDVPPKEQPF